MIEKYVRLAKPEDVPFIVDLMREFHHDSPYKIVRFEKNKSKDFILGVIKGNIRNHICLVALREDRVVGFIVGAIGDTPFSSDKIASELGWFVQREARGTKASYLLFKAYEDWAYRAGAKLVQSAYLPSLTPGLDKFYDREGFHPVEQSYIKVVRI